MERLNTDVGSMKGTLQQAPEILHRVRVDSTLNIGDRMVDDLMRVLPFQPFVGKQLVGVESRSRFDALPDFTLERLLFPILDNGSLDFTAPLYESDHGGFALHAASGDAALPLRDVHVPRLAADEGFVNFDFALHLGDAPLLERVPDAVKHEPSRS